MTSAAQRRLLQDFQASGRGSVPTGLPMQVLMEADTEKLLQGLILMVHPALSRLSLLI